MLESESLIGSVSLREFCPLRERPHLHGGGEVGSVAETEFALGIVSPRPQGAIGFGGEGVRGSGNLRPGAKCPHLHRRGAVDDIAETELALGIVSPRPQGAVGFGGEGKKVTSRNGAPGAKCPHLHRRGAVDGIAEAEGAVIVVFSELKEKMGW